MSRLAEIAKASSGKLKGKVNVNYPDGTSKIFDNEELADKATAGLELEHRRGAFFVKEAPKVTPALEAAPALAPKKKEKTS